LRQAIDYRWAKSNIVGDSVETALFSAGIGC